MRYSGGGNPVRLQAREGSNGRQYEPMMTSPDLLDSYATAKSAVPLQVQDQYARKRSWEDQRTRLSEVGQTLQQGLRDAMTPRTDVNQATARVASDR